MPEAQFAYWQRPQIHPGARELLATTVPACAVSNIDRTDLDAALTHHELAGYFTHLVTSQDARAYKPRPELFTTALGLLGLGPHEVIHVGDSLASDVAGSTPWHAGGLGQPPKASRTRSRPEADIRSGRPRRAACPA